MLTTVTQKSQASPEQMGLAICKEAEAGVQEAMQAHLGVVGTSAQSQQEKREMDMKIIGSGKKLMANSTSKTTLGKTRSKILLFGFNNLKQR